MGGEVMVIPGYNRILLGCAGTGDQEEDYRDNGAKDFIQYSDISFIHVHNLNNAKLFYRAVKTLTLEIITILVDRTCLLTEYRRKL